MAQQSGVRRGVARAEPKVGRQRVGRPCDVVAVGQVDLVGVAGPQLLLHLGERSGVPASGVGWCAPPGGSRSERRRALSKPQGLVVEELDVRGSASRSRPARSPTAAPGGRDARRSRSSRPSARRRPRRRGRSRCSSTPKTSSPTTSARPPWCRVTSRRAASKVSDTSSSSSTPTRERRPDQSRSRRRRARTPCRCGRNPAGRRRGPGSARLPALPGRSRRARRRGATGSTPGGTARPRAGSSRCRTAITTPSAVAVTSSTSGTRRRRASGSAPRRTVTGCRRARRVPRGSPTRPRRGQARSGPPSRRTT